MAASDRLPRLGILVDLPIWRHGDGWACADAFLTYLLAFRQACSRIVLIARVLPCGSHPASFALGADVDVVALPPYGSLRTLLSSEVGMWPEVLAALDAGLRQVDLLWLNFAHPISMVALQRAKPLQLRCFAVLRGNYVRDAAIHAAKGTSAVAAMAMRTLMAVFAAQARRAKVPCLAMADAELRWLQAQGLTAAMVPVSLLPRAAGPQPTAVAAEYDVLAVGRFDSVKGFDILLDALVGLCRPDGAPATLVIVGDGPEGDRLRAKADQLGLANRVNFTGRLPPGPELWHRYRSALAVAIPSRTEGTPAVAREAMALGTAVVASAIGGLPDLLGGPPPLGWLVPPEDSQALRIALQQAMTQGPDRAARVERAIAAAATWRLEDSVAAVVEAWRQWGLYSHSAS